MEKPFFIISKGQVVINWFLTIVLGSFLEPVFSIFILPSGESFSEFHFGMVLLNFIVGLIASLPSCFLLLMVSVLLNSKQFVLDAYWTKQNLLHAVIAIVSFLILGFVFHFATFSIAVGFTTAGFLIWNTFFILEARKQNLNK